MCRESAGTGGKFNVKIPGTCSASANMRQEHDSRLASNVTSGISRDKNEKTGKGLWQAAVRRALIESSQSRGLALCISLCRMNETSKAKVRKLQKLIDALCGIYTRVARRLGVHRTFVSRVARGERHSNPVEGAVVDEYDRMKKQYLPAATRYLSALLLSH